MDYNGIDYFYVNIKWLEEGINYFKMNWKDEDWLLEKRFVFMVINYEDKVGEKKVEKNIGKNNDIDYEFDDFWFIWENMVKLW